MTIYLYKLIAVPAVVFGDPSGNVVRTLPEHKLNRCVRKTYDHIRIGCSTAGLVPNRIKFQSGIEGAEFARRCLPSRKGRPKRLFQQEAVPCGHEHPYVLSSKCVIVHSQVSEGAL